MAEYIGNCNDEINWSELITQLKAVPPRERGNGQEDDIHTDNPKVQKLMDLWTKVGISKSPDIQWVDFIPGQHFDMEWLMKFAEWVDAEPAGAWVSAVSPGCIVPFHPDYGVPEEEAEWLKKGDLKSYGCYICEPAFGQVSIVEGHAIYNAKQGDVYKWDDWQDWHGGMNMGLETKYLFNFLGWDNGK
jgi:hypothetical protein